MQHAFKSGLNKINDKQKELARELGVSCRKTTVQYDLQGNFVKEWISVREASKQLNIRESNISLCCHNKRKTAGGYIWRYKDTQ